MAAANGFSAGGCTGAGTGGAAAKVKGGAAGGSTAGALGTTGAGVNEKGDAPDEPLRAGLGAPEEP